MAFLQQGQESTVGVHKCVVESELHEEEPDRKLTYRLQKQVDLPELLCHILEDHVLRLALWFALFLL
jgi:hypothetical protein